MSKSAVIYWSGTGNTEAMAQAVLDGLNGAGEDGEGLTVNEAPDDIALAECTALGKALSLL